MWIDIFLVLVRLALAVLLGLLKTSPVFLCA